MAESWWHSGGLHAQRGCGPYSRLGCFKYLVPSVRVKWKRLGEPLHVRTRIYMLYHVHPDPTLPHVIRPDSPPLPRDIPTLLVSGIVNLGARCE
jgi:hypothetical protein